ncbi:MAG: FAD-dependent oxidoreductase [Cyanobacteria bacterium J06588_5]
MTADLLNRPSEFASDATTREYDVVVVGGGIVGLTLACGLRSTDLRVAVIESQSVQQAASRARAYAFSPVSARILDGLGLWNEVGPQLTHFQRVKLSDSDYQKALTFRPEDGRGDAVYYSAEHTVLMRSLQSAVQSAPNIDYWCESAVLEQTAPNQLMVDARGEQLTLDAASSRCRWCQVWGTRSRQNQNLRLEILAILHYRCTRT